MNNAPLVSIIAICYNHTAFLERTINSILQQNYPNLEVILIDDHSSDNSVELLRKHAKEYNWLLIENNINIGLCKSFNKGLKICQGEFVIDLALDDILLPARVNEQVRTFQTLPKDYAIVYSNANYIDENDQLIGIHHNKEASFHPSGNLFTAIVQDYFICSPTVMTRKNALLEIGGYDEELQFEDWDFWLRISRKYKFSYIDKILTEKRILKTSLSSAFFNQKSHLMHQSIVAICRKITEYCSTAEEKKAFNERLNYQIKEAYLSGCFDEMRELSTLYPKEFPISKRIKVLLFFSYLTPQLIRLFYSYYRFKKALHN